MTRTVAAALVALVAISCDKSAPVQVRPWISGGGDAVPGEFPWMTAVFADDEYQCGGFLYRDRWVVTAAHCVRDFSKDLLKVRVGRVSLNESDPIDVSDKCLHPEAGAKQPKKVIRADIAILTLENDLSGSSATLAAADGTPDVIVTGWGATRKFAAPVPTLQKITVESVSNEVCKRDVTNTSIEAHHLCYGKAMEGKGSCNGDSGGPVMLAATKEVVGVVSTGDQCGAQGHWSAAIRVSDFKAWLDQQTSDKQDPRSCQ